ncbi:recombinase RecT [Megasphaera sueciensis]|uniref:recombinase RecT n=1 Tax=Megasphaera sueciensis TaxID=349094 RepID=UPI003D0688BD
MEEKQVATTSELNMSERFMNKVFNEFGGNISGELRISDYQQQLVQGYFIVIDKSLKMGEEKRLHKNAYNDDHKYDNTLPMTWNNVNLNELALDVVHYARLGLDMMEPNHLFPIPFKNKSTGKYDITLMPGYNGIKYIANNYALVKPKDVRIELVHKNDHFKPIKKSRGNDIETYEFDITDPFDRGEIIGGFGYIEYDDERKNELIMMSMKDILKRKPQYASVEFWGGQTTEWKNKKKETVQKDGWLEEMCTKTLIREVYSPKHIPRDPKKVDDSYQYMKQQELRMQAITEDVQQAIDVEANSIPFEEEAQAEPQQLTEPVPKQSVPESEPKETVSNNRQKNKKTTNPQVEKQEQPVEDEIDQLGDAMFEGSGTAAGPTF